MTNLVALRRELVAVGREMQLRGLVVAAEGNLSVRVSGHCFLVTPAGARKGDLRVQDLVEVDLQGRTALGKPTTEWPLHSLAYRLRPDIGAVCHAHAPWATAFAAAGRDLDGSLLTETADLLPRVPLAARSAPGTSDLAESAGPYLRDSDAVLLGNHGVVAVGSDLRAAFATLQTVERLAQVTLLAEIAAGKCPLDEATVCLLQKSH